MARMEHSAHDKEISLDAVERFLAGIDSWRNLASARSHFASDTHDEVMCVSPPSAFVYVCLCVSLHSVLSRDYVRFDLAVAVFGRVS